VLALNLFQTGRVQQKFFFAESLTRGKVNHLARPLILSLSRVIRNDPVLGSELIISL
jgi:hypothetical protein